MSEELRQLEARRDELRRVRDSRIARAQASIAEANRQFDEQIKPIARQINKLRGDNHQAKKPMRRKPSFESLPDTWSEQEKRHFEELLRKATT